MPEEPPTNGEAQEEVPARQVVLSEVGEQAGDEGVVRQALPGSTPSAAWVAR